MDANHEPQPSETDQANPETKRSIQESVEALEAIELDPTLKVEFLLVLAELKPATEYDQAAASYDPRHKPVTSDLHRLEQLAAWGKASGLAVSAADEFIDAAGMRTKLAEGDLFGRPFQAPARRDISALDGEDRRSLFVAKDDVWLEKMQYAHETGDDELRGECFGFPETARRAFNTPGKISDDSIEAPAEIKAFANFMLSRTNWQAELDTARQWGDAVRTLSPSLYEHLVERQRQYEISQSEHMPKD